MLRVSFFFQAEDGIRDLTVTGVQTCALPICQGNDRSSAHSNRRGTWGLSGGSTRRAPGRTLGQQALDQARVVAGLDERSGERRVGEEGRSWWAPDHLKKKKREIALTAIKLYQ